MPNLKGKASKNVSHGSEGFYFMHLSFTPIQSSEVREQPWLIKISEHCHICRCLPVYYHKAVTHQPVAMKHATWRPSILYCNNLKKSKHKKVLFCSKPV